jgi:bifunctional DNA-binding transcriptional regulator/antitoxin component of YhaV-PrlF toxin-antitoxin module
MTADGRLVVPRNLRDGVGMGEGGNFVAHVSDGRIILEPLDLVIARIQEEVARYVLAGVSLVDELVAERLAEAAEE